MVDDCEPLSIGSGDYGLKFYPPSEADYGFQHRVDVKAGPFSGSLKVFCIQSPWEHAHRELAALSRSLKGTVDLFGYEEMGLSFTGDGLGHINVKVSFEDHPLNLSFEIDLDQTQLPAILTGIDRVFLHPSPAKHTPPSSRD
jgi:hypothetical protein